MNAEQIADEAMSIEPHTCKHQCQYNDLMQSLDTERATAAKYIDLHRRVMDERDTERAAHEATQFKLAVSEASLRLTEEAFLIEKKRVEATKADSFDRGWNAAIEAAKALVDGYDMFDATMRRSNKDLSQAISQLKKDTG